NTFPLIVTPPRPFAGLEILTFGASHLAYAYSLMSPIQDAGIRYLISGVDVLTEAQISQFDQPNLDPYSVPEPASVILRRMGMTGIVWATPQLSRPGRGHDRPRCRGGPGGRGGKLVPAQGTGSAPPSSDPGGVPGHTILPGSPRRAPE